MGFFDAFGLGAVKKAAGGPFQGWQGLFGSGRNQTDTSAFGTGRVPGALAAGPFAGLSQMLKQRQSGPNPEALSYFNQQSPEDQASIRNSWSPRPASGGMVGQIMGMVDQQRQNGLMNQWYDNARSAGSVPSPAPVAPQAVPGPSWGQQIATGAAPLAQMLSGLQSNPGETYESIKAKHGVAAARAWEQSQK